MGTNSVYYQAPSNQKMTYPCIIYEVNNVNKLFADNKGYMNKPRYKVTLITTNPDAKECEALIDLPLSSFDTHYTSNNVHHYVYNIYY